MGHTNSTTNYALPQFITTDKPAWLTDVNTAYSAIDTAIKNAADAASTASGTATQAASDASTALTNASAADAKGTGAVASIAPAFETTSTYTTGSIVMYNSLLYICTVPVIDPGPWSGSANWERYTVSDKFDDLSIADLSDASDLIKIVTFGATGISINANNFANIPASSFGYSVPDGYTPIAIKKIYPNNYGLFVYRYDLSASGSGTLLALTNLMSAAVSGVDVSIDVVFAKNNII